MTWLTSLPEAVLVISGLVLALLVAIGGRLAVRALILPRNGGEPKPSRRRSCPRSERSSRS